MAEERPQMLQDLKADMIDAGCAILHDPQWEDLLILFISFLFHLLNVGITTDRDAAQMYSYGRTKQGGYDNE